MKLKFLCMKKNCLPRCNPCMALCRAPSKSYFNENFVDKKSSGHLLKNSLDINSFYMVFHKCATRLLSGCAEPLKIKFNENFVDKKSSGHLLNVA